MKINMKHLAILGIAAVILYIIAPKLVFLVIPFLPLIFCGVMCLLVASQLMPKKKNEQLGDLKSLEAQKEALELRISEVKSQELSLPEKS